MKSYKITFGIAREIQNTEVIRCESEEQAYTIAREKAGYLINGLPSYMVGSVKEVMLNNNVDEETAMDIIEQKCEMMLRYSAAPIDIDNSEEIKSILDDVTMRFYMDNRFNEFDSEEEAITELSKISKEVLESHVDSYMHADRMWDFYKGKSPNYVD